MNNFNEFDAYLNGDLSEKDKLSFEKRIKNDEDFNREFEEHKNLVLGIETYYLKNLLKNHKLPESEDNHAKYPLRKIVIGLLLLFTIVFLTTLFLTNKNNVTKQKQQKIKLQKPKPKTTKDIFAFYYNQDPGLPTKMGKSDELSFYKGMVEYKAKNIQKALTIWDKLQDKNDTLTYYKGMTYLALDKLDSAYNKLAVIDSNSDFYPKAQWYKLMILIKKDKKQEAKKLAGTLISKLNTYRPDDIKKIYNDLKKDN